MRRMIIMLNLKDKNKEILKLLAHEIFEIFEVPAEYAMINIQGILLQKIERLSAEKAHKGVMRIKWVINKYG